MLRVVAQVVARWVREEADRRQWQRDSVPGGPEMAVSLDGDASSEELWPTSPDGAEPPSTVAAEDAAGLSDDDDHGVPAGLAAWRRRTGWTAPVIDDSDGDDGTPGESGLDEVPAAGLLAWWRAQAPVGGHPGSPGAGADMEEEAVAPA